MHPLATFERSRARLSGHTAVIAAIGLIATLALVGACPEVTSRWTLSLATSVAFAVFSVTSTIALALVPPSLTPAVRYPACYALAASYATLAVRIVMTLE